MYQYTTRGTCSRMIEFDVKDNRIESCRFTGGCSGNTQGVAVLVKGMDVDDAIARLEGIDCGGKGTSCPDQLARALKMYKKKAAEKAT